MLHNLFAVRVDNNRLFILREVDIVGSRTATSTLCTASFARRPSHILILHLPCLPKEPTDILLADLRRFQPFESQRQVGDCANSRLAVDILRDTSLEEYPD